jgi:hypothetical protein
VKSLLSRSPGAVGPASRLRRRYADAPAAALLTGLATREWSPLALRPHASFSIEELWGSAPRAHQGEAPANAGADPSGIPGLPRFLTPSILAGSHALVQTRSSSGP